MHILITSNDDEIDTAHKVRLSPLQLMTSEELGASLLIIKLSSYQYHW